MKIYNSKKKVFYILLIFISLIFVGLVGAIIRLINIPAVLITMLLIAGLSYSKNMDSNREKVVLNPGDYVMRIQQGNSENASYEFKLIIRAKNK